MNIVDPDVSATKVNKGWVGEKDYANQTCSAQKRLKIHVKYVRSITYLCKKAQNAGTTDR
jgi:hypothetical protein